MLFVCYFAYFTDIISPPKKHSANPQNIFETHSVIHIKPVWYLKKTISKVPKTSFSETQKSTKPVWNLGKWFHIPVAPIQS